MSITTAPPPATPKKRGLGCLGCGCLILALLIILFFALVGGVGYFSYQKVLGLTSTTPADVPAFTGTDDVYNAAQQKASAFNYDLKNHQAATIQLSADEINALLARSPDLVQRQVHLFVAMTNDQAQVQGSIPTNASPLTQSLAKDRYFNFNATFGLHFNSNSKSVDVLLQQLQIRDQPMPQNLMPTMQAELTVFLNAALQKDPTGKDLLQQARSIEIKDGEVVIQTQ